MKITLHILTLLILTTLVSCGRSKENKTVTLLITDTLQTTIDKKEKERLDERREIKWREHADSLRRDKVLRDALKIANKNFSKERFVEKYDVFPDSIQVSVEINLDDHFSTTNPHLIIRRTDPGCVYIDIYSKGKNKFEKVISHEQGGMTYVSDTIRDINGDGLNDFLVNWYGSSGCCLKAFSNVYLFRQDKKTFSRDFEFINPTFSAKEKIIRGVCYGHIGKTEMYKYKWNGEKVDTLEYVFYEKDEKDINTGKVIISTHRPYEDNFKILKVLNVVPPEYKKIEGYDWFSGKGFN